MSFKIDIHPSNTLRITYSGKITKEEIDSVRVNARTMVKVNKLEYILVDLRKAMLNVSEMDLFNIASSQKKVYGNINKTAIIYTAGRHSHHDLMRTTPQAATTCDHGRPRTGPCAGPLLAVLVVP